MDFLIPIRDLASIAAFYELIEGYGFYDFFGADMEAKTEAMCA